MPSKPTSPILFFLLTSTRGLTMFDMGPYKALAEFVRFLNPENSIATIYLPGDNHDEDFQNAAKTVAETFNQVILFEGYLRRKNLDKG